MSEYLLLIDFINDLAGHDPMAGEIARRSVLHRTGALLARARSAGIPVGHVRVGFSAPDMPEAPLRSPLFNSFRGSGALQLGEPGTAVVDALTPKPGEADIVKHQVSPFYRTILDEELARHGVTTLYVCGISTAFAVSSAVREGHDRGLAVKLVADCCAAATDEIHAAEVDILSPLCEVVESQDIEFGG